MLKYFSVLYAGHVLEGEGIGFDGIPANDRWYANDRCARAFDIARDLAHHMEALGYDILWVRHEAYLWNGSTPQWLYQEATEPLGLSVVGRSMA